MSHPDKIVSADLFTRFYVAKPAQKGMIVGYRYQQVRESKISAKGTLGATPVTEITSNALLAYQGIWLQGDTFHGTHVFAPSALVAFIPIEL